MTMENTMEVPCAICGVPDDKSFMELKEFHEGKDPDGEDIIHEEYVCQPCATRNPYGE
jgi:hypothetical protein